MQGKQFIHAIGLAVAGLAAGAGAAHAQLTSADVGLNPTFTQSDPTTVTSTGGFFSGRTFFTNTTDFDAGTLTYGGPGSPATLTQTPIPPSLSFTASNPSFSGLQSDFPTGDYTFDLTGGTMGPTEFVINYAGDAYSNTPELTAASFAALQGVASDDPFTVDFNAMEVSPNATTDANTIVFSIFDSSSFAQVFSATLSTSDTSVTIPGGTLSPNQTYIFDLLFDDRITDSTAAFLKTQFYDTHTGGSFFTSSAIPEPSTWAMMLIGFGGLGFAVARRGRKPFVVTTASR
ncbi:MAG TPA: PEPxxWA-CTERM sorting domain-containing protein [Roseiarcus sp.]